MGAIPNNLPLQLSSFIGREREIAEIKRLLGTCRLVMLTGAGGCGKTRLALQVAADLCWHAPPEHLHADGVWLVEFASLSNPSLVPQSLASTLGLREQSAQPLPETLTDYLRDKHLLLVMDNCEHLIAACARLIESLLQACPDLCVLATSREAFNIAGENTFLVPPLQVPPRYPERPATPNRLVSPIALQQYEAVQLFLDRARASQPRFILTPQNAAAVAQVCHRLDGIPLAIELAAARVRALSVEQIASRLDDVFLLLTSDTRTALPRHQTLRALIDWSFALLAEPERTLFRRLSVFAGGWTLEAAEQVAQHAVQLVKINARASRPTAEVSDLLAQLVNKSLILAEEQRGTVRYRMLETIRQYAGEQLANSEELKAIRERHLLFFCELAAEAEPRLRNGEQQIWFDRFESEHDNFRTALDWAHQGGNLELGSQLAGTLRWFWYVRGYWSEGLERSMRLLALSTKGPDEGTTQSLDLESSSGTAVIARSCRAPVPMEPQSRARLLNTAASMAYSLGERVIAHSMLAESLAIARALGPAGKSLLARTLNQRGRMTVYHDPVEARLALEEGVKLAGELGDRWERAFGLNLLGVLSERANDKPMAQAHFLEALTILRSLDDRWFATRPLVNLASSLYRAGNYPAAQTLWQEGETLFRELGDTWLIAYALGSLGDLARLRGDLSGAHSYYKECLTLMTRADGEPNVASPLGQLGYGLRARTKAEGEPEPASRSFRQIRPANWIVGIHRSITAFAKLSADIGQPQAAIRMLGSAKALQVASGLSLPSDELADIETYVARARGQLDAAVFELAWAEGRALSLEQAIAYANSVADGLVPQVAASPPTAHAFVEVQISHSVRIFALGAARVYRGPQLLTAANWTYAKARELLFYLLCHSHVTKGAVGLALWPDISAAQLRNIFGVTMYHARHALGDSDWITLDGALYTFNRSRDYWFDVEAFESNLAQAQRLLRRQPPGQPQAMLNLQTALNLYQGDFLQDVTDSDWCLQRREELRRKQFEALLTLGQLLFSDKQYAEAVHVFERAISQDSYLEVAHRELMRCYVRQGDRAQALRHYRDLLGLMRDELGALPATETTSLFDRIRRGDEI